MKKFKTAIIGTGNIANFQVPALKASGFNITSCVGSKESKAAYNFSIKHRIPNTYYGLEDLFKNSLDI